MIIGKVCYFSVILTISKMKIGFLIHKWMPVRNIMARQLFYLNIDSLMVKIIKLLVSINYA